MQDSDNKAKVEDQIHQSQRRAAKVDLVYIESFDKAIQRQRHGRGFVYKSAGGKKIQSEAKLKRIKELVVPPAWQDVKICEKANGHIQAVGEDQAGRRQYIYHPLWQAVSSAVKFDRLLLMGELLPRIRRRVRKDLGDADLTKDRVLASVVRLLDKAHLRVGNQTYVTKNGSHGATTLYTKHVAVSKNEIHFDFPGKSGKQWEITVSDPLVAKVIEQCQDIPGQFLMRFLDQEQQPHRIDSGAVNDYLFEISGSEITAKDFRTWAGSTIALAELANLSTDADAKSRKKSIVAAVAATAKELGNTKAVCRSSYIHPGILTAAESGELPKLLIKANPKDIAELTIDEERLVALLPHLEFT